MLEEKFKNKVSRIIEPIAGTLFLATIVFMAYALFAPPIKGEANLGDFSTFDYNDNWTMVTISEKKEVTLPLTVPGVEGQQVFLKNTLPDTIENGMSMCQRVSIADVQVYIDGELRESYSSDGFDCIGYYIPSAYVITELSAEDAGKPIKMVYTMKANGIFHEIRIGYGNNVWFEIIKTGAPITAIAILLMTFGFGALFIYSFIIRKRKHNMAVFYLGQLMVMVGVWMLSESAIRQLVFHSPSLTNYFTYTALELFGFYIASYFDEVQSRKYHTVFILAKVVMIIQLIVNVILDFSGAVEMYQTLIFSHLWMIVGILLCAITLIKDIDCKDFMNYHSSGIGMFAMLFMGLMELICFYYIAYYHLGTFLSIGLILMLFCTLVQLVQDELRSMKAHENQVKSMTIATIETIANTLDAKDPYTGGHSARVGEYATVLAEAVAEEYQLTPEQVQSVNYIGKMHDIGKIGIPDSILNKNGRLEDDEFAKMKEHVTIGDEMLAGLDVVEGLQKGVRHHHERWDGNGYPDHLKGEEIPLIARLLCLADCYDAMTTNRVYRRRLTDQATMDELKRCSGTQFDPHLAEVFCRLIEEGKIKAEQPVFIEAEDIG